MSRVRRLSVVLVLNLLLIAALVVVGVLADSLGVLAEGGDYLADAAAIGVSLLAIRLSRKPPTAARPGGYPMATTWAAGVNAGWLLALSILIIVAAVGRLVTGTRPVAGLPVLIVSGIAAVVMFAGAVILASDDDSDGDAADRGGALNMRAVFLDTAADAAAAAGVAVAGALILISGGLFWLDPVIAGVIAVVVGVHAVRLLSPIVGTLRDHYGPAIRRSE